MTKFLFSDLNRSVGDKINIDFEPIKHSSLRELISKNLLDSARLYAEITGDIIELEKYDIYTCIIVKVYSFSEWYPIYKKFSIIT